MKYGALKLFDVANGSGVRTSLFVSGCLHHCKGCFQPETWNFDYGEEYTSETEEKIIDSLRPDYVAGFSLLGGEPFEPANQRILVKLLKRIREELPKKNIWVYSGFTWEEIRGDSRANCEVSEEMLSYIDVLIDGRFVESKKNAMLAFRGSENQRIIDVQKSLNAGNVIEIPLDRFPVKHD